MIAMYFTGLLLAVSYRASPGWASHPVVEAAGPVLDIRRPTSRPIQPTRRDLRARYQLERGGLGRGRHHRVDVAGVEAAVLGPVGVVDRPVEDAVNVDEGNVLVDPACLHVPLVGGLRAPVPAGHGALDRADVELVVPPHDPDGDRIAQRAVRSQRGDPQLVRVAYRVELFACPRRHRVPPL